MHEDPVVSEGRHIPFKREGWGIAIIVCVLAVVTGLAAFYVHKSTFRPPTDVQMRAAGASGEAAPAAH